MKRWTTPVSTCSVPSWTARAEADAGDLEGALDGWPRLQRLGTPAAPRLEDGYLYLLRGVQR